MGKFIDNPSKRIIREEWSKPLIRFISDELGFKLLYLGLPGPKALDLLCWIGFINHVIAFICRDYPNPSSVSQSNASILQLVEKLSEFERQGQLDTFAVYDGFMEEVVLRGRDTDGNPFNLNDIVTIYNLDFCNGITVPLSVTDDDGNIEEHYKSEVIKKLLEIQKDHSSHAKCSKFVMFITIHSNFLEEEWEIFEAQTKDSVLKGYIRKFKKLNGKDKTIRLLNAYLYNIITNFFSNCKFTPEILPTIYYKGSGKSNWLMHFTVIGSYNKNISSIAPCYQAPQDFLNQKMLTIKDGKIDRIKTPQNITEIDCMQDSVEAFGKSKSYSELWKKTKTK